MDRKDGSIGIGGMLSVRRFSRSEGLGGVSGIDRRYACEPAYERDGRTGNQEQHGIPCVCEHVCGDGGRVGERERERGGFFASSQLSNSLA